LRLSATAHSLTNAKLVDEYRILIHPVYRE
jgi:hypothetical protein